MPMLDLRLSEFLEEVASEASTPASGSLAALVTAASGGLLAKIARSSRDTWPEARGIAAQAEALRDRAAPLAQIDAEQYEAALRAPAETVEEAGQRRDFALGQAYARAAEPPLRIIEAAADIAELSVTVARNGDPSLRADAAAAGAFAAAAARAAAELVAINLTAATDDPRVVHAHALAEGAARAADEAYAGG